MIQLILIITIAFGLCVAAYHAALKIISLWTGCNKQEAAKKLHSLWNKEIAVSFNTDTGFIETVWTNVRSIIGEKRYEELVRLSNTAITTPLLYFGFGSGLPYIAISLYYKDENEKNIIENVISNIVVNHLRIYGYDTSIKTFWKTRDDLQMPYLQIFYARNQEEERIFQIHLQSEKKRIIAQNNPLIDDTENEDLRD